MHRTVIAIGLTLVVLGGAAYFGSGMASATALIPAFFGVPIAACGLLAAKPARRTGPIVAAGVIALLGLGGSLSRIVPALTGGEGLELNLATGVQILMALLTAVLVLLIAVWFARSRNQRPTTGA